jgi:hypothetical protein
MARRRRFYQPSLFSPGLGKYTKNVLSTKFRFMVSFGVSEEHHLGMARPLVLAKDDGERIEPKISECHDKAAIV